MLRRRSLSRLSVAVMKLWLPLLLRCLAWLAAADAAQRLERLVAGPVQISAARASPARFGLKRAQRRGTVTGRTGGACLVFSERRRGGASLSGRLGLSQRNRCLPAAVGYCVRSGPARLEALAGYDRPSLPMHRIAGVRLRVAAARAKPVLAGRRGRANSSRGQATARMVAGTRLPQPRKRSACALSGSVEQAHR